MTWALLVGSCSLAVTGCPRHQVGPGPPLPPPPMRPPTMSCNADRSTVYAGSGDFVVVHAFASSPDSQPLTYTWSANGGTVEGTGPEVRWNSSGTSQGTYIVNVRVDDVRGGAADCSLAIKIAGHPASADGHESEIPQLPKLPAWTLSYPLPPGVAISNETEQLGRVFDRIREALSRAGIVSGNWSAYAIGADGFAIVSRIEHIRDDGLPAEPRWNLDSRPDKKFPKSITEFLSSLVSANPGRYRVLVLAVTDRTLQSLRDETAAPSTGQMQKLIRSGEDRIPNPIRNTVAGPSRRCIALIYEFYRPSENDPPRLLTESTRTGPEHLHGAGLWPEAVLQ